MVAFQDYYEVLGVGRGASAKEIHQAYRRLARQYHPDANKSPDAESRFKLINEAHEVLNDPEKRRRYDALGKDWRTGQEFTPPAGWENVRVHFAGGGPGMGPGGMGFDLGGGGFSDFFEMLFGPGRFAGGPAGRSPFGGTPFGQGGPFTDLGPDGDGRAEDRSHPRDNTAAIDVTLEEVVRGARKTYSIDLARPGRDGTARVVRKRLSVTIPPGVHEGTRIRLPGREPGEGDLYLLVRLAPHRLFAVDGDDITLELPVAPWEAVLGAKVAIPTLEGGATLTIPPGSRAGQRLRLRGQGLPGRDGGRGDLYARLRVEVPPRPSDEERRLFERLAEASRFEPRAGMAP